MRLLVALLVAIGAIVVIPPVTVFAGTQGTPCQASDPSRYYMYEMNIGDTDPWDGSSDVRIYCGSTGTLGNHTLLGTCNAGANQTESWNNCPSSFSARIPPGFRLCFYAFDDYNTLLYEAFNPGTTPYLSLSRVNFSVNVNNKINSARFTSQASC